ncbi:hypothetical protein BLOT_013304 [Blomia tropicalis]|nr:hypothetical protein BLOT_013304 [Blomia tropicalis]
MDHSDAYKTRRMLENKKKLFPSKQYKHCQYNHLILIHNRSEAYCARCGNDTTLVMALNALIGYKMR